MIVYVEVFDNVLIGVFVLLMKREWLKITFPFLVLSKKTFYF